MSVCVWIPFVLPSSVVGKSSHYPRQNDSSQSRQWKPNKPYNGYQGKSFLDSPWHVPDMPDLQVAFHIVTSCEQSCLDWEGESELIPSHFCVCVCVCFHGGVSCQPITPQFRVYGLTGLICSMYLLFPFCEGHLDICPCTSFSFCFLRAFTAPCTHGWIQALNMEEAQGKRDEMWCTVQRAWKRGAGNSKWHTINSQQLSLSDYLHYNFLSIGYSPLAIYLCSLKCAPELQIPKLSLLKTDQATQPFQWLKRTCEDIVESALHLPCSTHGFPWGSETPSWPTIDNKIATVHKLIRDFSYSFGCAQSYLMLQLCTRWNCHRTHSHANDYSYSLLSQEDSLIITVGRSLNYFGNDFVAIGSLKYCGSQALERWHGHVRHH